MKQLSLLILAKTGFVFYQSGGTSLLQFPFSDATVQDAEVIDKELLKQHIKQFVEKNKITPSTIAMVLLPNTTFQKDFINPKTVPGQKPAVTPDEEIQQYIENIPFEKKVSKIIVIPGGVRVIATNQELFDTIKRSFDALLFTTEVVAPFSTISQGISPQSGLTVDIAHLLLQRVDQMKQTNFLSIPKTVTKPQDDSHQEEKKETTDTYSTDKPKSSTDKKRLIMMLGVFGILIIIMVFMYLTTYVWVAPAKTSSVTPTPFVQKTTPILFPSITATPSAQVSPSAAAVPTDFSIQIIGNTSSTQSAVLKERLNADGFQHITLFPSRNIKSSSIVFDSTVTSGIRDTIISEVRNYYPSVSVTESTKPASNAIITLGL